MLSSRNVLPTIVATLTLGCALAVTGASAEVYTYDDAGRLTGVVYDDDLAPG